MSRYIDADKLIKFANNSKDKTIDANDIARFPTADVVEKDLLTDRPCAVCKYNTAEKGCTQWDCVFGI